MPDHSRPSAGNATSGVRFTVVVQSAHTLEATGATGRQIKAHASVPDGFALFRRVGGETQAIQDDEVIEVNDGDHFFAQPTHQGPSSHR
jgi:hypothetical protein